MNEELTIDNVTYILVTNQIERENINDSVCKGCAFSIDGKCKTSDNRCLHAENGDKIWVKKQLTNNYNRHESNL